MVVPIQASLAEDDCLRPIVKLLTLPISRRIRPHNTGMNYELLCHLSSYSNSSNFWVTMPNYFAVNLTSHTWLLQPVFAMVILPFKVMVWNDSEVKLFLPNHFNLYEVFIITREGWSNLP